MTTVTASEYGPDLTAEVIKRWGYPRVARDLRTRRRGKIVLLATRQGVAAGFVEAQHGRELDDRGDLQGSTGTGTEISEIFVDATFRREGVGGELLDAAFEAARAHGDRAIFLYTWRGPGRVDMHVRLAAFESWGMTRTTPATDADPVVFCKSIP
ncbi:GNAT family N-acetyltransferase [Mumia zhuanghuii]|uniref:GNAT family N-acetyltransferase n=2 Tax=Mumia TaxID=1546255 RepID=A0ABW1QKE6_9ACTN|nr:MULTISPECIES: GNAT family N-acetyltransferase [Mumia]KAA1423311.1 GNAT family N-acetyltransferase [Mumia zhuanghuii]